MIRVVVGKEGEVKEKGTVFLSSKDIRRKHIQMTIKFSLPLQTNSRTAQITILVTRMSQIREELRFVVRIGVLQVQEIEIELPFLVLTIAVRT